MLLHEFNWKSETSEPVSVGFWALRSPPCRAMNHTTSARPRRHIEMR
jgi:hypothetical protein